MNQQNENSAKTTEMSVCFNATIGSLNCRCHVCFTKYDGAPCLSHLFQRQKRHFRLNSPSAAAHQKRDWVPLPACLHHPCRIIYVQSGFTIRGPSPETGLGTTSGYTTGRPSFDSTPTTILAKRVIICSHWLNGWAQPLGGNICP